MQQDMLTASIQTCHVGRGVSGLITAGRSKHSRMSQGGRGGGGGGGGGLGSRGGGGGGGGIGQKKGSLESHSREPSDGSLQSLVLPAFGSSGFLLYHAEQPPATATLRWRHHAPALIVRVFVRPTNERQLSEGGDGGDGGSTVIHAPRMTRRHTVVTEPSHSHARPAVYSSTRVLRTKVQLYPGHGRPVIGWERREP